VQLDTQSAAFDYLCHDVESVTVSFDRRGGITFLSQHEPKRTPSFGLVLPIFGLDHCHLKVRGWVSYFGFANGRERSREIVGSVAASLRLRQCCVCLLSPPETVVPAVGPRKDTPLHDDLRNVDFIEDSDRRNGAEIRNP
jgi:hypothetical protein